MKDDSEGLPEWVRLLKTAVAKDLEEAEREFLGTPQPSRACAISSTTPPSLAGGDIPEKEGGI